MTNAGAMETCAAGAARSDSPKRKSRHWRGSIPAVRARNSLIYRPSSQIRTPPIRPAWNRAIMRPTLRMGGLVASRALEMREPRLSVKRSSWIAAFQAAFAGKMPAVRRRAKPVGSQPLGAVDEARPTHAAGRAASRSEIPPATAPAPTTIARGARRCAALFSDEQCKTQSTFSASRASRLPPLRAEKAANLAKHQLERANRLSSLPRRVKRLFRRGEDRR